MTIEELLNSMQNKYKTGSNEKGSRNLPNNKHTWERIQAKDSFEDLGFTSDSEKDEFLREWCQNNEYSNIA